MGNLAAQWQNAKRTFEATAQKKKPGKKFLGVVTLASGIQPVLEKMEKVGSVDFKNRQAALTAFKKKATDYLAILKKSVEEERKTNADVQTLATVEMAHKALKKDLEALVARAEADYKVDYKNYAAQIGAKNVEAQKKGVTRGAINFGPDLKSKAEIVADMKKVDAMLARFASKKSVELWNKGGTHASIAALNATLQKWNQAFKDDIRGLAPFVKAMPANFDAKRIDVWAEQVGVVIKRLKPKLAK